MDADWLRELQDRGRFFYESFPGAAAAAEWKRNRERPEQKNTRPIEPDSAPDGDAPQSKVPQKIHASTEVADGIIAGA